jgi:hypothetical protein
MKADPDDKKDGAPGRVQGAAGGEQQASQKSIQ